MSLKFKKVWITPEDEKNLSLAIDADEHPEAYKWVSYVRSEFWWEWKNLNDGDHLKEAYRDEVWTWNDEDLET